MREVGCYLSHIAASRAFLATPDEHGLICEDDLVLGRDFSTVLAAALRWRDSWNVLRLTGLSAGHAVPVKALGDGYALCVNFGRLKGAGAYVVDRAAAAFVAHLLPMWLPWDHAIDREWWQGLRRRQRAAVSHFPDRQRLQILDSIIFPPPAPRVAALVHHAPVSGRERSLPLARAQRDFSPLESRAREVVKVSRCACSRYQAGP